MISSLPSLRMAMTSTVGLSVSNVSIDLPFHCNSFHDIAGPKTGDCIYPTESGVAMSLDNIKTSNSFF